MPKGSLYFVAIVPPQPQFEEILKFKQEVSVRYGSKAALRSPPHLTLHMPFRWTDKKLPPLKRSLTKFFSEFSPITIRLEGFGSFPPRVIFVRVESNPHLNSLQSGLREFMTRSLSLYNANYRDQPFHPHITIAFRDLRKSQFTNAWRYYQSLSYDAEFQVNQIFLLRHNGQIWEQDHGFNLAL